MKRRRTFLGILLVLSLIAVAVDAKPQDKKKKGDPVKDTAKQISTALSKNDAATAQAGFAQAVQLQGSFEDKKLGPVVKAIGKGITHKDAKIALAAIGTLGKMKVKGSSKYLGTLLKPPAKVNPDMMERHKAALRAAGAIHDPATTKTLEKLLSHANPDIAATAAEAFAGYQSLDSKPKLALVDKLIGLLGKLEKKAAAEKKDEEARAAVERVASSLNGSLKVLTGNEGASKAEEWSAWLKEQKKREKEGKG